MTDDSSELPFFSRLIFAYVCFFKVLLNGRFAARAKRLAQGQLSSPDARGLPERTGGVRASDDPTSAEAAPDLTDSEGAAGPKRKVAPKSKLEAAPAQAEPASSPEPDATPALLLLSLLQREGRFVDFVQQDIASFDDTDVGTAARVVHDGCRKALSKVLALEPVRSEVEGSRVQVPAGYHAAELRLTGNVSGAGPFNGTLAHRGWRVTRLELPELVTGHDARVLAQAEVEI